MLSLPRNATPLDALLYIQSIAGKLPARYAYNIHSEIINSASTLFSAEEMRLDIVESGRENSIKRMIRSVGEDYNVIFTQNIPYEHWTIRKKREILRWSSP